MYTKPSFAKETERTRSRFVYYFPPIICTILHLLFISYNGYAETSSLPIKSLSLSATSNSITSGSISTITGTGTLLPDLFTGTLSYSIPIDVLPGRKGIAPSLGLTYSSGNGNGWVGTGWDIEVGAIERSIKNGVDYSGDDFLLRMAGSGIDLINVNDEYRAKIESGFLRIKKLTASDGRPYWEVTDKSGTRYFYGQNAASRQDDPADPDRIFKWCLDKVQDPNGNFMTLTYFKNQGQIYPDKIEYTGNENTGVAPTKYVKFYLEPYGFNNEAVDMYTINFKVETAYRLKTIDVIADGLRVRAYRFSPSQSEPTEAGAASVGTSGETRRSGGRTLLCRRGCSE